MSLRLRLTLFYALLVGGVLLLAGVGLRLGLERILRSELDQSLHAALILAGPWVNSDNGQLSLSQEGELLPQLPPDLTLLLFGPQGLVEALGKKPQPLPSPREGCFTTGSWRLCGRTVEKATLLAGRPLAGLEESLAALDRILWVVAPGALLLALGLGYLLMGRALNPVRLLTQAARERAVGRIWNRPLPEPAVRDELFTLSRAFNELLQSLGELIESERRFTQDAAHELRTPLTVLLGRLEQAQEENRDPQVARALEHAHRSAGRMLALVEKLLHLARAEAGQGLLREPLLLNRLLAEEAEDLRPLFEAKGLALRVFLWEEPLEVMGDRLALGLALRNLLENALKFTAAGEVRLTLRKEGQEALLQVEDTGGGFPEEALPHVFQRFYQARVEHRRNGSGLGLALVAAIVRWHGGTVKAANLPQGAQIGVRLPLRTGSAR
ncbi:integral membrane sensor signal transduction histidine kinase [Allomeiothermus silvanus DSM 9946]|uniref:histidine kinase n=1 Tax=Allomeiothermus silvanus (strain ATCC 700542 / DSM 9946 / NBRC 106475 / NCIMB 13440 / VI-R2) TaxID=526227 RepID=D7BEB4_ALLS1|nr:HAMP domain-containing sensor histidine kinase [Allomeiothermus silvanus]ADH64972.1 integral membrane sensor signal transduction histidine kinase [Allomeiothermus silvanus DSM 9946]